ncbi:MAG: hypothetical protein EPO06_09855 [Burkholderiaceae bacterium]|nr:MAG: hypothetical protein EPO06_09855 [Burkholderiaceae bacterium]
MSRTRKLKGNAGKRDSGQHLAIPRIVLECPAYRTLSHVARSLLLDIAMQYCGHNNGKLVACKKYLEPLGWRSADTVTRAKRDLLASGLLIETRKGARPNKAAWYGLAWFTLDQSQGLDIDPDFFERERKSYRNSLIPCAGIGKVKIAPRYGTTG